MPTLLWYYVMVFKPHESVSEKSAFSLVTTIKLNEVRNHTSTFTIPFSIEFLEVYGCCEVYKAKYLEK